MTIRRKILMIFLIIIATAFAAGSYIMWQIGRTNDFLKINVPQAIDSLNTNTYLDGIAYLIRYDDEVLTQSARNYAFTGKVIWRDRYNEFAPKLDLRIKQALEKGDAEDKGFFDQISGSNAALIDMETRAIELVNAGDRSSAQVVLDSEAYADQKALFKAGLDKYLAKRGAAADDAIALSTTELNEANAHVRQRNSLSASALGGFIVLNIALIGALLYILYFSLIRPLGKLKEATKKIATGDLDQKLEIRSRDEVGDLSAGFNQMAADLKESRANIEQKVADRTDELQKLNKFMTGREIKMIELKDRVKELEDQDKGTNENKK